jgi:hypothetical protein
MAHEGMTSEDLRWLADNFAVTNKNIFDMNEDVVTLKVSFAEYCEKHGGEMDRHVRQCHAPFSRTFKKVVAVLGSVLAVLVALKELGWFPF